MAARRKAAKKKARKAAKPKAKKRRMPSAAQATAAAKDVIDRIAETMQKHEGGKTVIEFYGQIIDHCQTATEALEEQAA